MVHGLHALSPASPFRASRDVRMADLDTLDQRVLGDIQHGRDGPPAPQQHVRHT